MAGALSPPSGTTIIDTNQSVFVDADITATGFSVVNEWLWDIIGITEGAPDNPPNFVVTPAGMVLNVAYVNYDGLFLLQNLRYLTPDGSPVNIAGFEELPPKGQSPEIVLMIAPPINTIIWEMIVTAKGMSDDTIPVMTEATATYTIQIEANYDINRDALVAAVDERR